MDTVLISIYADHNITNIRVIFKIRYEICNTDLNVTNTISISIKLQSYKLFHIATETFNYLFRINQT